jgi:CBS domain-containing protein
MALNVMKWKNIRHLPIENENEGVIGVIHHEELLKYADDPFKEVSSLEDLDFIKLRPDDKLKMAKMILAERKKDFALVFENDVFCGIITDKDL